jgi:hypothetical protein
MEVQFMFVDLNQHGESLAIKLIVHFSKKLRCLALKVATNRLYAYNELPPVHFFLNRSLRHFCCSPSFTSPQLFQWYSKLGVIPSTSLFRENNLGAKGCTTYCSPLEDFPENRGSLDLNQSLWFISMTPVTLITGTVTP